MPSVTRHRGGSSGVPEVTSARLSVCAFDPGAISLVDGKVPGACGIAKLPNGHVLVGSANLAVELDRAGKRVWELKCPGYVRRIHRR